MLVFLLSVGIFLTKLGMLKSQKALSRTRSGRFSGFKVQGLEFWPLNCFGLS